MPAGERLSSVKRRNTGKPLAENLGDVDLVVFRYRDADTSFLVGLLEDVPTVPGAVHPPGHAIDCDLFGRVPVVRFLGAADPNAAIQVSLIYVFGEAFRDSSSRHFP